MFGHSEHFNDFHYKSAGVDFICFTDDPNLSSAFWQIRLIPRGDLDPARRSKELKALPHKFLPDYDWSLYIDNTVLLLMSPEDIFERYLAPAPSPMACFRHPWRDCIYDEAEAVIAAEYDDPARVGRQMDLYRSMGYPTHRGLTKTTFILRRQRDAALQQVMERWHRYYIILCATNYPWSRRLGRRDS
jgi:hypothetical protein